MASINSVITLTFGDMAENHVGMEQIGKRVESGEGFHLEDLETISERMSSLGLRCELINLSSAELPPAHVLIIRNGVSGLLGTCGELTANSLLAEQQELCFDKQAFMYGRVVNKHARWNLCYDHAGREPFYEEGKGRIIGYDDVPITYLLMNKFEEFFGNKATHLKVEANYYYDVRKCGIGFHGDSERRKVIGVRLGHSMPLHFQWFYDSNPIGERIILPLDGGDIYIMSEKAVGTDWKKKKIPTLRHATGCSKFTTIA